MASSNFSSVVTDLLGQPAPSCSPVELLEPPPPFWPDPLPAPTSSAPSPLSLPPPMVLFLC